MSKTDLEPFAGRTYRVVGVLAVGGTIAAAVVAGGPGSLGFAIGALFSGLNFHLWHRMVRHVGDAKSPATALLGGRLPIFALAGYAILNYFEANVLAALVGCFVAVAAVIFEVLLELIYGT